MEKNSYLELLSHVTQEMQMPLNDISNFVYTLKEDEYRPSLAEDERCALLSRIDTRLLQLRRMMGTLTNMTSYSSMTGLDRKDRVLLNQLCRELAAEQDVEVVFTSDIPDYYAVNTHLETLMKVLSTLLQAASERALFRTPSRQEPRVCLDISEQPKSGQLTISVSDTGEPTTLEEDLTQFNLPTERPCRSTIRHLGLYNCRLMVVLLGGFIYIDPKFRQGRRVVINL